MDNLLNSSKIFMYKGDLHELTSRIDNYDLIIADNIVVNDSDQGLYGSYSIFHPSSVKAFIIDQGDLGKETFRQSMIAYNYVEDINLHRIHKDKALPIAHRPPVIIISNSLEWMTTELQDITRIIDITDLPSLSQSK